MRPGSSGGTRSMGTPRKGSYRRYHWLYTPAAHDAPFEVAKEAWIKESKLCHPDNGGSHESQVRLNAAWDMARKAYGRG